MNIKELFKVAYYPGCEAKTINEAADQATRKVCEKLCVGLVELKNAGCCGSIDLRVQSPTSTMALCGRILSLAEETGVYTHAGGRPYLFTICNTCAYNLQTAAFKYNERYTGSSEKEREKLNKILARYGRSYEGTTNVITLPWLMIRLVGYAAVRNALSRPLKGLRIAAFYGCHMMRPDKYYGFESPMKPSSIDVLINHFMDGETIDYKSKSLCCGFHTLLTEAKTSYLSIGNILKDALDHGAEIVVTPCTQCQVALDVYQREAAVEVKEKFDIPVLHLSQLIGLAIGIPKEELGIQKNIVPAIELLKRKGF